MVGWINGLKMGKEKLSSAYSVCLKVLCVIVSPILEDFQGQTYSTFGQNIKSSAKYSLLKVCQFATVLIHNFK